MIILNAPARAYAAREERQERINELAQRYEQLASDLTDAADDFLVGAHFDGPRAARKALAAAMAETAQAYILRAWWETVHRDCDADELWEATGVRLP